MSTILYGARENSVAEIRSAPEHILNIPSAEEEKFPHGWRRVTDTLPDGSIRYYDIPLTPEDFLDPEPGDQMPQSPEHAKEVQQMCSKLEIHFIDNPRVTVFSDVKMRWGIPGLKEPFPDIAVIPDIKDRENVGSSFDVTLQGTKPCLIIEVMSPNYPGDDTFKVDIYEKAGVREYLILNRHPEDRTISYELTGYRLARGKYREMIPDRKGRLLSETTGILFSLGASGRDVVLTDADTGKQLLSHEEEHRSNLKNKARAEQAEAEIRRLREALARSHGET